MSLVPVGGEGANGNQKAWVLETFDPISEGFVIIHSVIFCTRTKLFNRSHSKIFKQGFWGVVLHLKMVENFKKGRCLFIYDYY